MCKNKLHLLKMSIMTTSLILLVNCDEDYVSSLSQVVPSISLETTNNLSSLYLGENIDNLELILKVEDSPSISSIGVTVNYNPDYFDSESMDGISLENNFFYNENENVQIYESPNATFTDGAFEINLGLVQNQENNHVNGDGEIARLYLSGINVQTDFNISMDQILSSDFPEYECGLLTADTNCEDWSIRNLSIGAPIPDIHFDDFIFTDARLSMSLNVSDLPKATSSQITIEYDSNILNFINYNSPIKGSLTGDFDLVHSDSDGEITFTFNQQDGSNSYIDGNGSLVILEFDVFLNDDDLNQSSLFFTANFNDAIYDICGGCINPSYSEHYDYDVSFWGGFSQTFQWSGCTDLSANNYNQNAIFNNGSCEYEVVDPGQIGG